MKKILDLLSQTSIQLRFVSLLSSTILFILGVLMGFYSWTGLLVGVLLGILSGILFGYETREPLYEEGQFPVTGTQKFSYIVLFYLYAVFIGCIVDRVQPIPSLPWAEKVLRISLFGALGYLMAYTCMQLVRLAYYLVHGGELDRVIWKERQTGTEGMIGRTGIVREALCPEGKIFIHGELWNAVEKNGGTVPAGEKVTVERIAGLTLYCTKKVAEKGI